MALLVLVEAALLGGCARVPWRWAARGDQHNATRTAHAPGNATFRAPVAPSPDADPSPDRPARIEPAEQGPMTDSGELACMVPRPRAAPPDPPARTQPLRKGFTRLQLPEALARSRELQPASQGLGSWSELDTALTRSLAYAASMPPDAVAVSLPGRSVTWGLMARTIRHLRLLLPVLDRNPDLLARHFDWYELAPQSEVTGYYAPRIRASLRRRPGYDSPIYRTPPDLLRPGEVRTPGPTYEAFRMHHGRAVPYWDRRAIDVDKVLADRGLEIAWATSALDVYDLHVQGGGQIQLPDGSTRYLNFSAKNGREFTSLGRTLLRGGFLPPGQLTPWGIREFFRRNPDVLQPLLTINRSYVFFEIGEEGPMGAIGHALTPRVSVATDPRMIPLGGVLALDTSVPRPEGRLRRPVRGLVLAQDTGGVITGTRIDYYIGAGRSERKVACRLKTPATVRLLILKQDRESWPYLTSN